jgi:lysophospholipase L1-like esterase
MQRIPLSSLRFRGAIALAGLFLLSAVAFCLLHGDSARGGPERVGPKATYLALGDSIGYGYQPNFDLTHGYADALFARLQGTGTRQLVNMACPGETTTSMLSGGCRLNAISKWRDARGAPSQLDTAVAYIEQHRGQVSPVTLTIGANDVIDDLGPACTEQPAAFDAHLDALGVNLDTIVSRLMGALDGSGDLLVTTYYNPFAVDCPATGRYLSELNQRITAVATRGGATVVDVAGAFDGRTCDYTWMCSRYHDIHATTVGYQAIADLLALDENRR